MLNSDVNSIAPPAFDVMDSMTDLRSRLKLESGKNQLQLIQELVASGEDGVEAVMDFLLERKDGAVGPVEGKAYQLLSVAGTPRTKDFLAAHFPQGVVPLHSDRGIDYKPLQTLLGQQDFQAADRLTLENLCRLAGETAVQRKWIYFTEVESFPIADLKTIDALWMVYSEGKFGFSVQREIWLGLGKNWDRLWDQIGWRTGNNWTRYPQGFIWDLTAPKGHLPLSNQLRGVRVIAALLAHPAWTSGA
jgi:GUN4-like/ARM-like repeat domain, GUN4-N terminal